MTCVCGHERNHHGELVENVGAPPTFVNGRCWGYILDGILCSCPEYREAVLA